MNWTAFDPAEPFGKAKRVDSYAIWAHRSSFDGLASTGAPDEVSILCEAIEPASVDAIARHPAMAVPQVYQAPAAPRSRYFTLRLARSDLRWLDLVPGLTAWELGLAVVAPEAASPPAVDHDWKSLSGGPWPGERPPVLIGLIDSAMPFHHQELRSRVRAYWDQGLPPGPVQGWKPCADLGYGRELVSARFAATVDEIALYRRLRLFQYADDLRADHAWLGGRPGARDTMHPARDVLLRTHGTHVAHLAAGRSDPTGTRASWTDAAAESDIACVQLPELTARDSSGGSLGVHLLDGLRYILARALPRQAVVANISYGTHAGPHDGSSLIERAIDDLIEARGKNFAVVLAAGNGRNSRGHAVRVVTAGAQPQLLDWWVPSEDTTMSFLELWCPAGDDGGGRLEVSLLAPGQPSQEHWVGAEQAAELHDGQGRVIAAVIHRRAGRSSNGDGAFVLIALRPCAARPGRAGVVLAPSGLWRIQLRNSGRTGSDVRVSAWVERDESGGVTRHAQSWLLGPTNDEGSFNSLATGRWPVVASGRRRRGADHRLDYADVGRGLRGAAFGADFLVPCEEDESQPGLPAMGVRSGSMYRMRGTSASAALLTRRLAHAMARSGRDLPHDQARGLLRRDQGAGNRPHRSRIPATTPAPTPSPELAPTEPPSLDLDTEPGSHLPVSRGAQP